MSEYCLFAQGYAKPATAEDLARDASGITDPNLHRRIDPELDTEADQTVEEGTTYKLLVQGVASYRSTSCTRYDEDSEIP